MKKCFRCKVEKPATTDYFYLRSDRNTLRGICIECWGKDVKAYQATNREYLNKVAREWRANNPDSNLRSQLKHKYDITLEEYREIEREQGFRCGICRRRRKLDVDHCHKSGKFRGLLCRSCNLLLGMAQDNVDRLLAAVAYVEAAAA